MSILLLFTVILSTLTPVIGSDPDIKRLRLKNGATVIYSPEDWGGRSKVITVFLKNGGALKFNKKSGFASLAQEIVSSRLGKVSRSVGFRYRSRLEWDYLVFTLFLPSGLGKDQLASIWNAFYGGQGINDTELEQARGKVLASIREDLDRKVMSFPIISFMVSHRSVYSVGVHGSQEDVGSFTPSEVQEFMRCYVNPSNSVIVLASEKNVYRSIDGIKGFKPCFRDERFEDSGIVDFNDPDRSVNYIRSEKKNLIIRLGFPANSCDRRESLFYDIASEVLMQDDVISRLATRVSASNQCYMNKGAFEIVLFDVRKDADEVTARLLQRIKFLASSLDQASLENARTVLSKSLNDLFAREETFVYALGKAQVSSGNYQNLLDHPKRSRTVTLPEIKKTLADMSENNMYKMYIKLER